MSIRSRRKAIAGSRWVLFGALGIAAGAAAFPRSAEAARSTECMDATWAEYNECLVESRWEALKKLCDLQFYADAYACARESIAE